LAPFGERFLANTYKAYHQRRGHIDAAGDDSAVVVWESSPMNDAPCNKGQDGDCSGVFAQRFSGTGMKVGGEFQVNATTKSYQSRPVVAVGDGGAFLIAWESDSSGQQGYDVFASTYDPSGGVTRGEFGVNVFSQDGQGAPAADALDDDNFVVVWGSSPQDDGGLGIYARRFGPTGEELYH
jgi:hypothetical protein